MKKVVRFMRRAALPIGVFIATAALHYVWLGFFPETDPLQNQWVTVEPSVRTSWLQRYIETGSYYLGYSYALSLAFASEALRIYREKQHCTTRNLAIGSLSFSGVLAVAGCFLLGCCGSPMLAVYLSLFGASFLPIAKPLVALTTTLLIGFSWWWMTRLQHVPCSPHSESPRPSPTLSR